MKWNAGESRKVAWSRGVPKAGPKKRSTKRSRKGPKRGPGGRFIKRSK